MNEQPLSTLKEAISAATRALSHKRTLQVEFTNTAAQNVDVVLPPLADIPSPETLSALRGQADHAALFIRHHNRELHANLRPNNANSSALFDTLEVIRVEALGSEYMSGVQHNLYRHFEQRTMMQAWNPNNLPLLASLELQARNSIQQLPIPAYLHTALEQPKNEVKKIIPLLSAMRAQLHEQQDYAELAIQLIEVLTQSAKSSTPDGKADNHSSAQTDDSIAEEEANAESTEGNSDMRQSGEESTDKNPTLVQAGSPPQ